MAIALDAVSKGGTSSGTTLTVSHVMGSGDDRVLYTGVANYLSGGVGPPSAISFDGDALSLLDNSVFGQSDYEQISLWRLVAPNAGTADVVVTTADGVWKTATNISFSGVDQADPDDAASAVEWDGVSSVSQVMASETGDLVLDVVAAYAPVALAIGLGQIDRVRQTSPHEVGMSTEVGAASVTMSWTTGATECGGHVAVNVNAAGAGGGGIAPAVALYHHRHHNLAG